MSRKRQLVCTENSTSKTLKTTDSQRLIWNDVLLIITRDDKDKFEQYINTDEFKATDSNLLDYLDKILMTSVSQASIECTKLLLHKYPLLINIIRENGDVALTHACRSSTNHMLKYLIECGVYIHDRVISRCLQQPGVLSKPDIVELLLPYLSNINLQFNNNETLLSRAYYSNHMKTVQLLLDHGADTSVVDNDDTDPLCTAAAEGHLNTVKLLFNWDININDIPVERINRAFTHACSQGHTEVVRFLTDNGADVNTISDDGEFAFLSTIRTNNITLATLLISRGFNVNTVYHGGSILLYACIYDRYEIMRLLLQHGADPNATEELAGLILLHFTMTDTVMMELLLSYGADPCKRYLNGSTFFLELVSVACTQSTDSVDQYIDR